MTKKTCKRPKGEKSHCIMSASSLKALETMINSYYFSKNYIITEDMTVYNTVTAKTLDSVYVKVTPAGRYQCRKIDVFGESKEPEKAEQKHDSEFSGSLLDGQLKNHLEESRKEEPTPTEAKGESTMKENTNAAVQATEETAEKRYTAAEIQTATGFEPENVRISAHIWHDMGGTPYNVFRAAFVAGTSYKIPAKYTKSAAAEICFTVVSNNGKSLKVNIYEKYNGKISEQMNKTKKLCPGSHGIWESYNPETNQFSGRQSEYPVEFIQIDCIDIKTASRWAKDTALSVIDCIPINREDFETWRQNTSTATTNPAQAARKTAEELDFTPVFYPVSEELARQHKNMISWSEYKPGTVTAEYQEAIKEAYELAKQSDDAEKSLYLADMYARRLARWYDDFNRNGASCPSVMISGAGNFPTRKKEKQNARFDTLMHQYDKIKHLLEKIRKPHGYGVEIRRDTITAEEFENILYFDTVINEEENRLQLIFDGKPEEEERNILKKNGFRWSPRFKAWQRQLTENAVAAVWAVVAELDKLEDAENNEIQAETEKIKSATPENERTETVEKPVETTESETSEIKKFVKGTAYSANGMKFCCTGTKPGFIRILIGGEDNRRIMSVFVKNACEYITYQHKTVTAFDIYADDTPTDGTDSPTDSPEQSAPETIPHTTETPAETPTEPKTGKSEETELLELPETKSIKIFWNGIKVNGSKTLTTKCHYYYGSDDKHITIYARDYTKLPRDLFTVINNSDSITDYFEQDHAVITEEHPLYKYFEYALDKQTEHDIKTYSRTGTGREFESLPNPGQPTAADLSAVARYNSGRAAAAKAAAEEKERAEQEEHDRQMSELCEFSDSMAKMTCEKYPIRENAPTVRIEWSEHPAFSDGFTMSISAAQILFSIFDEKQVTDRQKENHSGAWYYKTKFVIEYTDPETGEQSTYTGRQDLGDGEGGIIDHMLNFAEWERTHHHDGLHRYGAPVENPPETTDKLDFIKWLSGFLESSPDADGTGSTADTPDSAQAQKQAIAVTFAPELQQAAEKHSENYAECEQIMNDIDTAVSALPPEDIAHILDTLPRDTLGALMARRICQQYAKTDPANAAMLLGAWILDFTNDNGAAQ